MALHKPVNRPKRLRDPRTHILRAATDLFLEKGYGGTSIDDVIAVAGGSKATVAKYFGNKAGLFEAAVMNAAQGALIDLPPVDTHDDIEAAMTDYGIRVLTFYLDGPSLLIYRSLIVNAGGDPTAAQALYQKGHGYLVDQLATLLSRFSAAGDIACPDPAGEAQRFLHLIRAGLYEETLLGLRDGGSADEIRDTIVPAVAIFLTGLSNR
ncbi:MAG: TetR/AcrR family transcriptional regulator [Pseudomonadota bacterium]|nr:TetR/AcrR family transcriptional regulator [Pseudomonadota bacterium]